VRWRKLLVNNRKKQIVAGTSIAFLGLLLFLIYSGYLWPNNFFSASYLVHGIDISHHQKKIDWEQLARQKKYQFVFIKATEGNDFQDHKFLINWKGATRVGLLKGAYHYFTLGSSGQEQAMNFIKSVPKETGTLPPVIDLEERGVGKEEFQKELNDFIATVEEHYGQKPILYVVYSIYEKYIKGDFDGYPIWIRDVVKPPQLSDEREWDFWQYCDRAKLPGIKKAVDLNVFQGSIMDLKGLSRKNQN